MDTNIRSSSWGISVLLALAVHVVLLGLFYRFGMRIKYIRRQWLKFKRLSKAGPFFRFAVYLNHLFWRIVSFFLWKVYGSKMDAAPSMHSVPKIFLRERNMKSMVVSWKAKPSSFYSRDMYELEVRGCVGPIGSDDMSTEWQRLELDTGSTSHMVNGFEPGTCLEFRCRTVNSKGAGDWTPTLRAYTKQVPVDNGGRGPGYSWRQSNTLVQVIIPISTSVTAKAVIFSLMNGERIRISTRGQGNSTEAVLLEGILSHPAALDSADWMIETVPLFACPTAKEPVPGRAIVVSFDKAKPSWYSKDHWTRLIQGHPGVEGTFLADELELESF